MEIREQLIEITWKIKPKGFTKEATEVLIDAVMDGARRRGIAIVSEDDVIGNADEHLQTLKSIRRVLREAVEDVESKRDLAALTRRLQDISREVTTIEERHRGEKVKAGNASNGRSTASTTGPLDI